MPPQSYADDNDAVEEQERTGHHLPDVSPDTDMLDIALCADLADPAWRQDDAGP